MRTPQDIIFSLLKEDQPLLLEARLPSHIYKYKHTCARLFMQDMIFSLLKEDQPLLLAFNTAQVPSLLPGIRQNIFPPSLLQAKAAAPAAQRQQQPQQPQQQQPQQPQQPQQQQQQPQQPPQPPQQQQGGPSKWLGTLDAPYKKK